MPETKREAVELVMPASAAFVPLARLEVATIASVLDCTVDDIDDLRLAIEELCLWALRQPRSSRGRLRIVLRFDDSMIEATCTLSGDDVPLGADEVRPDPMLDTLSVQILVALVDDHGFSTDDGEPRAWFHKKRGA